MEHAKRPTRFSGLCKLAQTQTIGDVMNLINSDMGLSYSDRRMLLDYAVGTGLPNSTPSSALMRTLGNGLVGAMMAKYLGAGKLGTFASGVGVAMLGNVGYNSLSSYPERKFM